MRVVASRIPRLFGADAMVFYPWCLIVVERIRDKALIEHERVHALEQIEMGRWLWWARYLLCSGFRLACEVAAYRRQMDLGGITRVQAARQLCKYCTGVTSDQAYRLLGH